MNILREVAAAAAALMIAGAASADTISFSSNYSLNGIGSFDASISYNYDALGGYGTLVIDLTNTALSLPGYTEIGKIVGVYFNFATTDLNYKVTGLGVSGTGDDSDWSLVGGAYGTNGNGLYNFAPPNPFGKFMAGYDAAHPNSGVFQNDTGTFTFKIEASDASSLTAGSFTQGGNDAGGLLPDNVANFAVRMIGWEAPEGSGLVTSDKLAYIPVPAPVALAGVSLLAVVGLRLRRKSL